MRHFLIVLLFAVIVTAMLELAAFLKPLVTLAGVLADALTVLGV